MSLMDIVRRRFASELQSHQIDEDYTLPVRPGVPLRPSDTTEFDPDEMVPSYETSQLMHEQQTQRATPNDLAQISRTDSGVSSEIPVSPPTPTPATSNGNSSAHGTRGNDSYKRTSIKQLGLKFLNARQHFALAICRDISLIPALIGLVQSWKQVFVDSHQVSVDSLALGHSSQHLTQSITSGRVLEHFLTGVWCIVSAYLSYSALDSLIVRWIVIYLTPAAIVRVLSMSTIMVTIESYLVSVFTADGYKYGLHIWILISCCLTLTYIGQNFVTSNLDLRKGAPKRARFFDIYNIVVFAVVPVGLASFITMIGLLRSLLILRIDIDQWE
ncbi:uncharacterized protein CANTADRAFT_50133 [Suhomyces tanzawaensis NRRL Y-17324]|uniref:N-glycosylation protein EOS1 n=1 Tax=Suhomyces tanzawaensis NRRL Y-17324 TaxID=984487 RepID=A0A1E4SLL6_9ASCO|nr:uncharacterized protein CANTADRAFT_50133 [Suhomyces tanzawaensis NRRL Y-17324]ODV80297.1 hypothetical protein CANTADRAFT_50133 [Suhomyces tanzawaensis NRRL Y-17324]